ncbi:MAG: type II toxin-antitoxin system prevent-host-death family antitoxin [Actinomycetota bacterium]|nr:type II toxin-antitoxin system prevent-host-death family antitoxin [Actinomycetota bacterium]
MVDEERSVGVRELRQNLSVYLRRVANGETLMVTQRGRRVAVLGPLPEHSTALDRLIASGRATPAAGHLSEIGPPLPADPDEPSLSEALEEQRQERL